MTPERNDADRAALVRQHVSLGWFFVGGFSALGLLLEGLHGWKVDWYAGAAGETRRMMWTLAHGTLLGLAQVAFGHSVPLVPTVSLPRLRLASRCLVAAAVLLPMGFFLGGAVIHDGDPGLGIALVPVGAALLIVAAIVIGLAVRSVSAQPEVREPPRRARSRERAGRAE